jgi:ABC-type nitrate/sulfonate/bicarbonate transport system, permease component
MSSLDLPVAGKRDNQPGPPPGPPPIVYPLDQHPDPGQPAARLVAGDGRGWIEPLFLPSPGDILAKAWTLLTQGYMDASLWQHLGASLGRIGLALIAATLTAIPVGIAIGYNRVARGILDPLIEFYRPIRRWPTCR